MSDIAGLLKSEIVRLSKKVIREHLGPIQSATTSHRRQLAAVKKQLITLEREIAQLRRAAKNNASAPAAKETSNIRFVAKGFRTLRARLGLSAEELGQLLGVSAQSIYNWENKKTVPRREQVAAIAALRGVGKREIRARLEANA